MTLPVSISPSPEIDLSHHRIHEGNHFATHKINTGLDPLTPKYFLIIPPSSAAIPSDTIKIHLIFEVQSNPGMKVEFFEDSVVSANGTPLPLVNNDRNSATVSSVQVFEDPTVSSEGTSIFEEIGGTTTEGADVGEINRDEEELILKVGSQYLLKLTPLAAGPVTSATTELNWYDQRPSSPV